MEGKALRNYVTSIGAWQSRKQEVDITSDPREIDVNFRLKTILSLHAEIANHGRSIAGVTINRTLEHENPICKIEQIPLTGL